MTARPKQGLHFQTKVSIHRLIQVILTGMIIYLLIAGFAGLRQSVSAVQHARIELVFAAACLVALSYTAAAITYCLLVVKPIPFIPTLLVQVAGGLVNRLLPAGLGGLGLNAVFLHRRKHSIPVATTIVATNNALGFIGNAVLLVICIVGSSLVVAEIAWPYVPMWLWAAVAVGLLVLCFVAYKFKIAGKLILSGHEIGGYFRQAARRPAKSFAALLSSMLVTSLHASALYVVVYALGFHASWPVALVAISAGAFTGAVLPTPGGLGGAEAGIAAALIALSTPTSVAVTAALLYRGLTYWVPLVPGYIALRIVEKRYL